MNATALLAGNFSGLEPPDPTLAEELTRLGPIWAGVFATLVLLIMIGSLIAGIWGLATGHRGVRVIEPKPT